MLGIDLPAVPERGDILRIHIGRRNRDPATFDVDALAKAAEAFSGAELEQAVVAGLYHAFADGAQLGQAHLVRAIQETFPLAMTMKEDIARLRAWAKDRTRPASSATGDAAPPPLESRFDRGPP